VWVRWFTTRCGCAPAGSGCAPLDLTCGEPSLVQVLGESVCPYCGVGCRLRFEGEPGEGMRIRGVESAAANLGRICAKGAQLGPTIDTADRLSQPHFRLSRQDAFQATDWDTALTYVGE